MALVTVGDVPVMSGRISLVEHGAWTASLLLAVDGDTVPSGAVTLKAQDGIDLAGYADPDLSGIDRANVGHVQLVGGSGGLNKIVSGSYRSPQLRDPLDRAMKAAGDTLSSKIAAGLLDKQIPFWTTLERRVRLEYYAIAREAGADVHWRYEPDGTLWIGTESWPTAELPEGTVVVNTDPSLRRTLLAVTTPALLPGYDVDGIGKIVGVGHWIQHDNVRSVVWV